MKHAKDIKILFRNATLHTDPARDRAILAEAIDAGGLKASPRSVRGQANVWRRTMRNPVTKLALAAAVVLAVVVGIYGLGGSEPAFADVVKPMLAAQTATYTLAGHTGHGQTMRGQVQFREPGFVRQVVEFGSGPFPQLIEITNPVEGKRLVLMPARKTALVVDLKNAKPQSDQSREFQQFREAIQRAQAGADGSIEYLGRSQIGGRDVISYRFTEGSQRITIRADARSLLPVQIEKTVEGDTESVSVVLSDIQFDVPLDPSLFSTAMPEGYTVQSMQQDESTAAERDLVELLRFWSESTGGHFPAALDRTLFEEMDQILRAKGVRPDKSKGLADPAVKAFLGGTLKAERAHSFVQALPKEADWHYAGKDATFGDATKPIFWYRPSGSATYRVIYADLSIRDVAPADLPK
jgi:outer membrane lipoprotein-sorting protein